MEIGCASVSWVSASSVIPVLTGPDRKQVRASRVIRRRDDCAKLPERDGFELVPGLSGGLQSSLTSRPGDAIDMPDATRREAVKIARERGAIPRFRAVFRGLLARFCPSFRPARGESQIAAQLLCVAQELSENRNSRNGRIANFACNSFYAKELGDHYNLLENNSFVRRISLARSLNSWLRRHRCRPEKPIIRISTPPDRGLPGARPRAFVQKRKSL